MHVEMAASRETANGHEASHVKLNNSIINIISRSRLEMVSRVKGNDLGVTMAKGKVEEGMAWVT